MPYAGLPQEVRVRPHMPYPHRFNELATKMKSGIGSLPPPPTHTHKGATSIFENSRGHAGVKGNDRADRLADKATITSGLRLGRSEVLRNSRHYLRAQSQGHHRPPGRERRGKRKRGERAIVNQTDTGTVSKAALGKLLRDGAEITL